MRLPVGASAWSSVPPPAPVPMIAMSYRLSAMGELRVQGHATVDEYRLAVDVVRIVGGQEHRDLADIVGLADAPVRNEGEQRFERLGRLPGRAIDGRLDRAGRDGIDPDAGGRQLLREGLHQELDAALG